MKHNIRKIALTKGMVALIDYEDVEKIMKHNWCFDDKYAASCIKRKKVYMHRFILNAPLNKEVDHINGNKLDNRKCNLRLVEDVENQWHRSKNYNNLTGFKGVSFNKEHKKYSATIMARGKKYFIGYFNKVEDAANAYEQAAIKYHGIYAST